MEIDWKKRLFDDLGLRNCTFIQFADFWDKIFIILNRKERTVIYMEYENSETYENIADFMSIGIEEVRALHYWALSTIKKEFSKTLSDDNFIEVTSSTPISSLGLSTRIVNVLKGSSINTYGDLLDNISTLRTIKNIGETSVKDIKGVVAEIDNNDGRLIKPETVVPTGTNRAEANKKLAEILKLKNEIEAMQSKDGVAYSKLLTDSIFDSIRSCMGDYSLPDATYINILVTVKKDLCKRLGLVYNSKWNIYEDEYNFCLDLLHTVDYRMKIKQCLGDKRIVMSFVDKYDYKEAIDFYRLDKRALLVIKAMREKEASSS